MSLRSTAVETMPNKPPFCFIVAPNKLLGMEFRFGQITGRHNLQQINSNN